ncbi:MAG: hypothetical protein EXS42_09480 [Lacunisphaera sp.]|nr:hypothetical protein [Lacunisphaera sp.]
MPPRPCRLIFILFFGLGGLAGRLQGSVAPETPATVVAVQVRGTVEVQHDKSTETEVVAEGTQLGTADTITTAAKSSVMLVLPNGSVVALKEKSRLKIAVALHSPLAAEALAANEAEPRGTGVSQTSFELAFGEMLTRVRKLNPTSTFTVQTPVSVAAVRGTVFEVSFQPDAKGEARYRLSTSIGLVHVTPHAGKMVAVPGDAQVDFTAELGKNGIKIKNLKSSKLARQKNSRLTKRPWPTNTAPLQKPRPPRRRPATLPGPASRRHRQRRTTPRLQRTERPHRP